MTGQALIVQGDALRLPLPDASVDLIVTSPPFAFLRAYDTGYPHLEVGAEDTPAEFLEHLWQATAEMVRVLKPTGSIFVDLGDKYSGDATPGGVESSGLAKQRGGSNPQVTAPRPPRRIRSGRPKSLMLLPERYRIGCVDQLGLIARAVIVWDKPNGLPESVTDRVRRSHEEWVHLTRQPRYYSAIDEIRTPQTDYARRYFSEERHERHRDGTMKSQHTGYAIDIHPLGKLPGSVWTIPSEPLSLPGYFITQDGTLLDFLAPAHGRSRPRPNSNGHGLFDSDTFAELVGGEDAGAWRWLRATGTTASPWPQTDGGLQLRTAASHYAAFPSRWPEQLIRAFSPPGICLDCGQGRVPVVERGELQVAGHPGRPYQAAPDRPGHPYADAPSTTLRSSREATILGYACACTPHTNHPGSGEVGGWGSYDSAGLSGAPAANGKHHVPGNYKPKVGPWREYHLDGWRPPPTRPAVVLDPFSGVGTTVMVARALGRIGVGVDLSMPYCRAARWRVHHDAAKAISRTNLERQGSLL